MLQEVWYWWASSLTALTHSVLLCLAIDFLMVQCTAPWAVAVSPNTSFCVLNGAHSASKFLLVTGMCTIVHGKACEVLLYLPTHAPMHSSTSKMAPERSTQVMQAQQSGVRLHLEC